ncbi:type I restriction-modification system subunit M [Candidatus Pelagibacter sp.]|nr:type I restriction-modification system subunit M [Candidatus Pelagibacter sp.]
MLTGDLKNQVDKVWSRFWSGGMANPLEIIEQITYLLFLKRLDDLQTLAENKSRRLKKPIEQNFFPKGKEKLRWNNLKNLAPEEMFNIVDKEAFPFLQNLGNDESSYIKHMQGARFTIPSPKLLSDAIDLLDKIPMEERDTKGDLYEYMLGKLSSSGQLGQFRTPRHIIQLMLELTAPTIKDTICDPACGTCGFLVNASEYIRTNYTEILSNKKDRDHFNSSMFNGYDFDNTMLRIGNMNMLLHGIENPNVNYRDSLSQDFSTEEEKFSLILANPPFKGSLDSDSVSKDLLSVVRTKSTELLFLALFLKLLKPGGRAAVIVPDGVLFKTNKANIEIRKILVEEQKLDAVISLPSGVFKPYAGVSTAILLFTKTNSGGTDKVWFYDVKADGWSLDDQRKPLLDLEKLGANSNIKLSPEEHLKNNLPDILKRWKKLKNEEDNRKKTDQSFNVTKEEIVSANYELGINKYQQISHEKKNHASPREVIKEINKIEHEIREELIALEKIIE